LKTARTDIPVITVDGPGGTGKGTVCSYLAATLGWHLLDSGALYRLVALAALRSGSSLDDPVALSRLAAGLEAAFDTDRSGQGIKVFLQGEEVTGAIRSEQCGNAASRIATYPGVRRALLGRQRACKRLPGLVADGRDMGTVVFPEAALKLYLTASPEQRAIRRYKQLKEQGFSVTLADLSAEIYERDERDQARTESPLRPAPGAFVLDTTNLGIEEVNRQVIRQVKRTFPKLADRLPIN